MNSVRKSLVPIVSAMVALCVTSAILVVVPRLATAGSAVAAATAPGAAMPLVPAQAG